MKSSSALAREHPTLISPHLPQHRQGLQQFLDPLLARALEAGDELLGGERLAAEGGAQGLDLVGQGFRPGELVLGGDGDGGFDRDAGLFGLLAVRAADRGILEFGPQPADQVALFLGGAFGVEVDQALEDFPLTPCPSPAWGRGE